MRIACYTVTAFALLLGGGQQITFGATPDPSADAFLTASLAVGKLRVQLATTLWDEAIKSGQGPRADVAGEAVQLVYDTELLLTHAYFFSAYESLVSRSDVKDSLEATRLSIAGATSLCHEQDAAAQLLGTEMTAGASRLVILGWKEGADMLQAGVGDTLSQLRVLREWCRKRVAQQTVPGHAPASRERP